MSTSLLLACGLNCPKYPRFVHISEEVNVDGSFVISSIIGQRVRTPNHGTILICLQHDYKHYCEVGTRLGYPLAMYKDKSLIVVDIMKEIATDFSNSKWTISSSNQLIENLVDEIQNSISILNKTCPEITIIIDNLCGLVDLGVQPIDLVKLCHTLNQFEKHITLVTKLNNCNVFDIIDNNLQVFCDLNIRVIKLKSGHFKEVDGRLNIINKTIKGNYDVKTTIKDILYKVDHKIHIFNPGSIGIKV